MGDRNDKSHESAIKGGETEIKKDKIKIRADTGGINEDEWAKL